MAPVVVFRETENGFSVSIGKASGGVGAAYRAALRASQCAWHRPSSRFVGALPNLLDAVDAVRRAGFAVDLSPSLLADVTARAAARLASADSPVPMVPGSKMLSHMPEGIRFMRSRAIENRSSFLADSMGLAKTASALMSLDEGQPTLVVCPKIAKHVWVRETKRWRPDLLPTLIETGRDFRWPRPGEVVILNFPLLPRPEGDGETVPKLPAALLATMPERMRLIGDEVHFVKEPTSQRTRAFKALSDAIREKGGVCWLLSGTPLVNRPGELWAVLQMGGLGYEAFGDHETFRRLFAGRPDPSTPSRFLWGQPDPEVAQRLARVMLRRTKEDVLDLPPKRHEIVEVDADLSDAALVSVLDIVDGGADTIARWQSLRDLDGLPIEELSRCRAALALAKLPAALDMLDQIDLETDGDPVVVFSAHRKPVDTIGKRTGWVTITGDTSTSMRAQIEEDFQAGKLRGIAATIAAAGTALTLTKATVALFVDQAWTPAANMQAEDRIYRVGQTRPVRIIVLSTTHPLDRRVNQLLVAKRALIAASIDEVARVRRVPI